MTRTRRRIVALVVSTTIGLVLCEALLWLTPRSLLPHEFRLLDRVYTARNAWENMMIGDDYLGYKLKPDLDLMFPSEGRLIPYRTTDHGFGDIGFREIGTKPPFDVVAVGDSYVLCDDVPAEACWLRHLYDHTGVSTATLGVNGYSTLAAERVLKRYGPPLHPKLVLAGMYPNDFKDNVNFDRWAHSGSGNFWVWLGNRRGRGQLGRSLASYSMLYRMADGFMRTRGRQIYKYQGGGIDYVYRIDRWWLNLLKNAETHPGFALMLQAYDDMRATSEEMGAAFAVLLFPTKEQIYWDSASQFAEEKNLDVDHPLEVVRVALEREGIHYCDLTGPLREEAKKGKQLFHRTNSHWNDEGNRAGARVIEECLRAQGLLPKGHDAGVSASPEKSSAGARERS
jgi:hypothetical protein